MTKCTAGTAVTPRACSQATQLPVNSRYAFSTSSKSVPSGIVLREPAVFTSSTFCATIRRLLSITPNGHRLRRIEQHIDKIFYSEMRSGFVGARKLPGIPTILCDCGL